VAAPPPGPVDFGDAALAALARARHPGALRRIGAVVADAMEDPKRRTAMLERLAPYALDAKRAFLEAAAADVQGAGDEIRIDAYEALVRADAPGVVERLRSFVEKGDLRSANLAALVFGRVRLPEAGRSLLEASRRSDVDDDTRTMCLRAVVLSGSPEHAADVVRAMARDRVGYDARKSDAQNIASQFGESTPAFRTAAGAALVQALSGEFGGLAGAGLVQIELSTVACCGEEAAPALARYLTHADLPVRLAAAAALGYVASADTERDLRAAWWTSADPAFRSALATAIERAHFRLAPPKR
jgi:HEAT repeat protein